MKVALFSDIHANLPALCKALESARSLGARKIICAGDIVGFGPHPTEVVRLLKEKRAIAVSGNIERKVAALGKGRKGLRKALESKKKASIAWTWLHLGEAERAWVRGLPSELRLKVGGADILVAHGSPLSDTDYIFPSITAEALKARLGEERPRVLACGHSHIPFAREVLGVLVVNAGSVGRPYDGDPRGSYALLDFPGGGRVNSRIVRFAYKVEDLAADLAARKVPRANPEIYRRGVRSLPGKRKK